MNRKSLKKKNMGGTLKIIPKTTTRLPRYAEPYQSNHYGLLRPPESLKPSVEITDKSTLDDLITKYSAMQPATVRQFFELNACDPLRTDFELKEIALEPTTTSLSKKSSSQMRQNDDDSQDDDDRPADEPELKHKSTSHQISTTSDDSPMMSEKKIGDMVVDFKEHHKADMISKDELDSIVDVIREGQKGVNYSEEKFLRSQFASDLMRMQIFIDEKTRQIIEESYVENGVNIHNREEFLTLGGGGGIDKPKPKKYPSKKASKAKVNKPRAPIDDDDYGFKESLVQKPNVLDELVADKKSKEEKTDELVNVRLSEYSANTVPMDCEQPLTKWMMYEDNLFVMGNVAVDNIVYPTRKLLQTSQSVSRYHVQQAEVFL